LEVVTHDKSKNLYCDIKNNFIVRPTEVMGCIEVIGKVVKDQPNVFHNSILPLNNDDKKVASNLGLTLVEN